MARVGEEAAQSLMSRHGCHPMEFTGRPMKGYVSIDPNGFDLEEDLVFGSIIVLLLIRKQKLLKKEKQNESTPYPFQLN